MNTEQLKAAALKATPGPWIVHPREDRAGLPYTPVAAKTLLAKVYSEAYLHHEQSHANAVLMAFASPENILALLGCVEALRHVVRMNEQYSANQHDFDKAAAALKKLDEL